MEENKNKYEFKQVEIRLKVKESDPLYSPEPVDCADKAIKLIAELMKDLDRECVYVINFDNRMHPISFNMAAMGGTNFAPIEPGNIFKSALLSNASNVILLHVHPSGNCTPSRSDIDATRRTALVGAVLGIALQDHLIVAGGTGEFISIREKMPDLFDDTVKVAESREAILTEQPMEVAEPVAQAVEPAPLQNAEIYNEVFSLMQRQQELMTNAPDAWALANEVSTVAYESAEIQPDPQNYEMQLFIADTADRIRNYDVEGIKYTLNNIAEASKDPGLIRKAFKLIMRLSKYDGEWENAPKGLAGIFAKHMETNGKDRDNEVARTEGETAKENTPNKPSQDTDRPSAKHFCDMLAAKDRTAKEMNSSRTAMEQEKQRQAVI